MKIEAQENEYKAVQRGRQMTETNKRGDRARSDDRGMLAQEMDMLNIGGQKKNSSNIERP